MRWDKSKSAFSADPITCNTERNYAFDVVAGFVLCDPHGRIKTCTNNKFGKFQTFESEGEALDWCKQEIAKKTRRNHKPSLRAVDPIEPPDHPPKKPKS